MKASRSGPLSWLALSALVLASVLSPSGCGCSDAPVETETDAVEVPGTTDEDAGQPGCAVDEDCPFGDVCEDGACRPSGPALDDEAAGATPTARRARAARSRPAAASTR